VPVDGVPTAVSGWTAVVAGVAGFGDAVVGGADAGGEVVVVG
jgi:hypothetical protein